jgi:hypothetical protein
MSDETTRSEDPDERAEELREHHEEAQERNPDERPPEERGAGRDATEEGLLRGVPGSGANRPTG